MYLPNCSFAFAGTYGHECGKPATVVAVRKTDMTKSGIFYARRCDDCAKISGGENNGTLRFEAFDADKHQNHWK